MGEWPLGRPLAEGTGIRSLNGWRRQAFRSCRVRVGDHANDTAFAGVPTLLQRHRIIELKNRFRIRQPDEALEFPDANVFCLRIDRRITWEVTLGKGHHGVYLRAVRLRARHGLDAGEFFACLDFGEAVADLEVEEVDLFGSWRRRLLRGLLAQVPDQTNEDHQADNGKNHGDRAGDDSPQCRRPVGGLAA